MHRALWPPTRAHDPARGRTPARACGLAWMARTAYGANARRPAISSGSRDPCDSDTARRANKLNGDERHSGQSRGAESDAQRRPHSAVTITESRSEDVTHGKKNFSGRNRRTRATAPTRPDTARLQSQRRSLVILSVEKFLSKLIVMASRTNSYLPLLSVSVRQ